MGSDEQDDSEDQSDVPENVGGKQKSKVPSDVLEKRKIGAVPVPKKAGASAKVGASPLPQKTVASAKVGASPLPKKTVSAKVGSLPQKTVASAKVGASPLPKKKLPKDEPKKTETDGQDKKVSDVIEVADINPVISYRQHYNFSKIFSGPDEAIDLNYEILTNMLQMLYHGQDAMVVFGGEQDSFKIPCFFGGNVLKQGKMIMSDANREALWLRAAADLLFLKQTAKQYGLADIDLEMSCGYYQNNTVVNLLDPVETKRGWLERRNHYILNGWKDDGPYIKTFARHL